MEECVLFAKKIIEDWERFNDTTKLDRQSITTHLPRILLKTLRGSIIMVEEISDIESDSDNETSSQMISNHKYKYEIISKLKFMKLRVKQKWNDGIHSRHSHKSDKYKKRWDLGVEWIRLWQKGYSEHNDTKVDGMATFLLEQF